MASSNILQYIFYIESSISILLGILGLFCLLTGPNKRPSDRMLAHLTVCNILSVGLSIPFEHNKIKADYYIGGTVRGIYVLYALILIIIMVDRILAVSLILRYRVIVTHKRLSVTLLSAWILCIVCGVLYHFFKSPLYDYVMFSFSPAVVLFFIASYTYIIIKVRTTRKVLSNADQLSRGQSSIKYWIPFTIILTYIFFQVTVDLIAAFSEFNVTTWHYILWTLNPTSDTLIYILGSSRLRSNMRKRLARIRRNIRKNKVQERRNGGDINMAAIQNIGTITNTLLN